MRNDDDDSVVDDYDDCDGTEPEIWRAPFTRFGGVCAQQCFLKKKCASDIRLLRVRLLLSLLFDPLLLLLLFFFYSIITRYIFTASIHTIYIYIYSRFDRRAPQKENHRQLVQK